MSETRQICTDLIDVFMIFGVSYFYQDSSPTHMDYLGAHLDLHDHSSSWDADAGPEIRMSALEYRYLNAPANSSPDTMRLPTKLKFLVGNGLLGDSKQTGRGEVQGSSRGK
ncbi:hypothetical protein BKA80DRAFT_259759 [Phyllosticta citrichinensis]